MPIWGWVCVGLLGLLVVLVGLFWVVVVIPHDRAQRRLAEFGETVVGRIFLANPTLYDAKAPAAFEAAFVVFTRDADTSEAHMNFLQGVIDRLDDFVPDPGDPDQQKIAWALETQRTVGYAFRVPNRLKGGREVYFATPSVFRRMLPGGKLTRDYLYLRVRIDGTHRDVAMIEYPDAPGD